MSVAIAPSVPSVQQDVDRVNLDRLSINPHPHAGHGCGAGRQFRAPWNADGHGAGGILEAEPRHYNRVGVHAELPQRPIQRCGTASAPVS